MTIRAMIDGSAVAAVITDPRLPDNPIIACNGAFEELTGYAQAETIGRNCRFLAGAQAGRLLSDEITAAVRGRRPLLCEIANFKKDGTPFRNAVLIVPIFDESGELKYFLGSQSEVKEPSRDLQVVQSPWDSAALTRLTARQQQVLYGMISGNRSKEIGLQLGITERTVKMHRADILKGLGVATSTDAIRLAVEARWHIGREADR